MKPVELDVGVGLVADERTLAAVAPGLARTSLKYVVWKVVVEDHPIASMISDRLAPLYEAHADACERMLWALIRPPM